MSFDISQEDWVKTPQAVKDYVKELHQTIKNLQAELNKYIQFVSEQNNPKESLYFNGLTDYLITPYALDLNLNGFSFESRINLSGNRSGEFKIIHVCGPELVNKTDWVTYGRGKDIGWLSYQWGGVWWGLYGSNGIAKAIHSDATVRQGDVNPPKSFMSGQDSVEVNKWHHVCGTWDGTKLKLYVNGELKNMAPYKEKVKLCTQAYIGAHYGATSQFFPGMLDNVRIWNRPLELEEVKTHHRGELIGDTKHLVLNYSARLKPVLKSGGSELDDLDMMERELDSNKENIPPAIRALMDDLKNYLVELDKKRRS